MSDTTNLAELGMDSLMGAEIKQTLERGFDVILGVQEIRGLTFAKLRALGGEGNATEANVKEAAAAAVTESPPEADLVEFAMQGELMPKQVVVKLPSAAASDDAPPVFMVSPREAPPPRSDQCVCV